jgi:hypothetical protein
MQKRRGDEAIIYAFLSSFPNENISHLRMGNYKGRAKSAFWSLRLIIPVGLPNCKKVVSEYLLRAPAI